MASRFYCPGAVFKLHNRCYLPEKARHHAGRVLRMRAGDEAELFDGNGLQAKGPIFFGGADAWIEVTEVTQPQTEPAVHMRLIQALVSPEKTDWIVEKAVEAGVAEIILCPAARSVTKLSLERAQKRLQRTADIAAGAAEQCGRAVVPQISFMKLQEAFALSDAARFILTPATDDTPLKLTGLKSCSYAVGPEGGFDETEIALAVEQGWRCARIGSRVLRTETAGIVFATLLNAASGDMRFV